MDKNFARLVAGLALMALPAGCGNGGGSSSGGVTINTAPTLVKPTAQVATEGQSLSFTLQATDPDAGDTHVYSAVGLPLRAKLNASTGAFTWTPGFEETGVHTVTFRVSDGKSSDEGTVTITVSPTPAHAANPLPGGTFDLTAIPKFVTPLVIPPVMSNNGASEKYDIAMRQFSQQLLPGGIWNTITGRKDNFPATKVWSYGPQADPMPDSTALGGGVGIAPAPNSQFNYPAFTVETVASTPVSVRWINGLVADPVACRDSATPSTDPACNFIPHLLPVDQNVHWANPTQDCADGQTRTDCMGMSTLPYAGPVPIVTHVHGSHVDPHSDGYPEAWWLPAASNLPAGYASKGNLFDDATGTNPGDKGFADFLYRNDQPATTLWYHDHALGMTRLNVYAGPAGFWLVRGGLYDGAEDLTAAAAVLPGPAPVKGQTVVELNVPGNPVRSAVREIPMAIQDRAFNADGSLFYPGNRAFFEGLNPDQVDIDLAPTNNSDVMPIWNPEAFFNVMLVNGVSWPKLEVAQGLYRFRLLNGCNSRFLNLALFQVDPATGLVDKTKEVPFYMIAAEQGNLPKVVKVQTGFATPLPGDGTLPTPVPAADPDQALLMALAERADVLVDFSGLPSGTVIRMVNTGPDEPFGGFGTGLTAVGEEWAFADPATTGMVMEFIVDSALTGQSPTDPTGATPATSPLNLKPKAEPPLPAAGNAATPRAVSLNEEESHAICVQVDEDENYVIPITQITSVPPAASDSPADILAFRNACELAQGAPFGPTEAKLGVVDFTVPLNPVGVALDWDDTKSGLGTLVPVTLKSGAVKNISVTENPVIVGGSAPVEQWDIYNYTADAHPIHLHLVRFEVLGRYLMDGVTPSTLNPVQAWESGFKDTVISYPGEVTKVKAAFDIEGLYVWHCHIVEHEDNEMMRPFVVSATVGPVAKQ